MQVSRSGALAICGLLIATLSSCGQLPDPNAPKEGKAAGKWGYINKEGKMIVMPQFDEAGEFGDQGAVVRQGKIRMRILADPPGKEGPAPKEDEMPEITPMPAFEAERVYGKCIIREEGEVIFEPDAKDEPEGLFGKNGLTCVHTKTGYVFLNKKGELAFATSFSQARPFSGGLAPVNLGKEWGYIDKTGRVIVQPLFMDAGCFHKGLAPVCVKTEAAK